MRTIRLSNEGHKASQRSNWPGEGMKKVCGGGETFPDKQDRLQEPNVP